MNVITPISPDTALLYKLKMANIDLTAIEPILDYAICVIDKEILHVRSSLTKIADPSLRHEYLARLDSFHIVKSKLTITELAHQIGQLDKEDEKLNVY